MSSIDIFAMAVRNLLKRKTRTFLTILGVVIGTSAIVVMISLGLAMNKTFEDELEKLGDITVITIHNPMYYGRTGTNQKVLDDNAIEQFKRISGVVTATPIMEMYLIFSAGQYLSSGISVKGIAPDAMEALGYVAAEGRLLGENDRKNVVFGSKAVYSFWNPRKRNEWFSEDQPHKLKPLETNTIKLTYDWNYYNSVMGYPMPENAKPPKLYNIKCLGILESKGYNMDYSIYMDINQLKQLKEEQERFERDQSLEYGYNVGTREQRTKSYDTALIKCANLEVVNKVQDVLIKMGYPCDVPSQSLDSMKNIATSLQGLLATIGAVSLFVATLGITNTMVTAIYERTREIGIMKVIGASLRDIRRLFLTEAALIGFIGGLIGVGLSIAISHFMNTSGIQFLSSINEFAMQTTVSLVTKELCGLAVLFSTVMGVLAGYLPARRAMKLSALSAIRTE